MTNPPCKYISHLYDREELADFTQYCFDKYQYLFNGPTRRYRWTLIEHHEDQLKLRQILGNLFEIFESIGQPLIYKEPKIFYSTPMGTGIIHKDPIGYKGKPLDEYSKWACNIPAVRSENVHLQFYEESIESDLTYHTHENINQRVGVPNFYQKYKGQGLKMGAAPEEQTPPVFSRPFTDAMILDTTKWHRSKSLVNDFTCRLQYFTYWDLQKSYQDTVEDLGKHLLPH